MEGPVTETTSNQLSFAEKAAPYYTFLWGTALLHSAHPHEKGGHKGPPERERQTAALTTDQPQAPPPAE